MTDEPKNNEENNKESSHEDLLKELQSSDHLDSTTQDSVNLLVQSILQKHGIKKDNIEPLSEEQKNQLFNLVSQFKQQADNFADMAKKKTKPKNKQSRRRKFGK
ncbi:hypothetical protein [Pseudalkalibacillus decolorationis]|uniref:hypothetical protein n=1 Tax=Pseudalkalibacillus decolorationis TaxID=163879 RepID=UPI0021483A1B|nr:hypothetical protein [Pseudalkalibacillus decolorationis]